MQARRIDHLGPRWFTTLGFGLIALGAAITIPAIIPGVPPEIAIVTWALPGLGMGFMYSAVTLVVLRGSPAAEQGSASSSLQLADILGTALGTGVAGAITAAGERSGGNGLGRRAVRGVRDERRREPARDGRRAPAGSWRSRARPCRARKPLR